MVANYTGISPTHWDEPEYETAQEQNLATYFIVNSDMIGVCPFHARTVAGKTRISVRLVNNIVKKLSTIGCGKLILSTGSTHLWWRSKLFHSLYKGNYSRSQEISAQKILCKWSETKLFGENFYDKVAQLYVVKYNLALPPIVKSDTPCRYNLNLNLKLNNNLNLNAQSAEADNQSGFKKPENNTKSKQDEFRQEWAKFNDQRSILEQKLLKADITELEFHQELIALYKIIKKPAPKVLTECLERLENKSQEDNKNENE